MTPTRLPPDLERRALVVILGLALIHGLLYVWRVPPWQHYDEPNHFEYVWLLARRNRLPQPGDFDLTMRRQVARSMIDHGFFEDLGFLPDLEAPDKPPWIGQHSQLGEPPLYYLLAAIPLKLLPLQTVDSQLYAARLVSLGLLLATLLAAYGALREITPPGDPLRLLVPLTMALIPSFVDLMTAANNDAAAVALFSFFIWAGLRLFQRGPSWGNLLWTGGATALCWLAKSTVFIALPLFALAWLLALVRARRRRWLWLGLVTGALAGLAAVLTWSEPAFWYRATTQASPTRTSDPRAPLGDAVLQIEPAAQTTPTWLAPLAQPLPFATAQAMGGQTVTLGAWMWASQPVQAQTPRLHDGVHTFARPLELGVEPEFYTLTATLAAGTNRLWVSLEPGVRAPDPGLRIYYDGLLLVPGIWPAGEAPRFSDSDGSQGTWVGEPFSNLLRNPSAEAAWPALRPAVDNLIARFTPDQSRPSMILNTLLDPAATGWYYRSSAGRLLRTFWAQFGWGQVPLLGRKPYRPLAALTLIGLLGAGVALLRGRVVPKGDVLLWLFILLWAVWGAALVRGSTFIFVNRVFIPVARYAYPAILPTTLVLIGGWRESYRLVARRLRLPASIQFMAYGLFFLGLDVVSLISILDFYQGR